MTKRDHGVPLLVAVTDVIFIRRFGHTHTHPRQNIVPTMAWRDHGVPILITVTRVVFIRRFVFISMAFLTGKRDGFSLICPVVVLGGVLNFRYRITTTCYK